MIPTLIIVVLSIALWHHLSHPNPQNNNDKDTIKIAVLDIQGFDITSPENTFSTYSNRYFRLVHDTLLKEKETNGNNKKTI
ncbi:MAG: hypothetical protein ACQBVK_03510 [Candidatus Phytoplasma sp. TWB_XP]